MKVYISGPISAGVPGADYTERKERFHRAEVNLRAMGHEPINPIWVDACAYRDCGGKIDETEHNGFRHTWDCYLKYDLIALLGCEAIALLPGWFLSKGSRLEWYIAHELRMPVFHLDTEGELE